MLYSRGEYYAATNTLLTTQNQDVKDTCKEQGISAAAFSIGILLLDCRKKEMQESFLAYTPGVQV